MNYLRRSKRKQNRVKEEVDDKPDKGAETEVIDFDIE